jgi:hypothetical protein
LFTQAGYNGTQSDFDNLISTNEQAFEDSYVLFTRSGYNGSREDYQNLIGLKKKDTMESDSALVAGEDGLDFGFDVNKTALDLQKRFQPESQAIRTAPITEELQAEIDELNRYWDNVPQVPEGETSAVAEILTSDQVKEERERAVQSAKANYYAKDERVVLDGYKDKILSSLTEEQRNDQDYIRKLEDKFFLDYGLDLDLEGNGRYNEQWLAEDFVRSIGSGVVDFSAGPISLIGSANPETLLLQMAQGKSLSEAYGDTRREMYKSLAETSEGIREGMTQYKAEDSGISASLANGDYYNGFRRFTEGIGGLLPQVGATVAAAYSGGTTLAITGTGIVGGVNYYGQTELEDIEAIENGETPLYDNTGERLGGAFVSGGSDALYAAIGLKGTGTIAKQLPKSWSTGVMKRFGVEPVVGAVEEGAAEATIMGYESVVGNANYTAEEYKNRIIDAGLLGYAGEVAFNSTRPDDHSGRARTAVESRSEKANQDNTDVELAETIAQNPESEDTLSEPYKDADRKKKEQKKERVRFFEMLSVRHPEDMNEVQSLDGRIEKKSREIEKINDLDIENKTEVKEALERQLEDLVAQREAVLNKHTDESLDLTEDETQSLVNSRVKHRIKAVEEELAIAQEAVDELTQKGVEGRALEDAIAQRDKVKKYLDEARRLMGEVEAARRKPADAKPEDTSEVTVDEEVDTEAEAKPEPTTDEDVETEAEPATDVRGAENALLDYLKKPVNEKVKVEEDVTKTEEDVDTEAPADVVPDDSAEAPSGSAGRLRRGVASAFNYARRLGKSFMNLGKDSFESVRAEILNNPENYIKKQNIQETKDKLSEMSNEELVANMNDNALDNFSRRNDDISVLAGIEKINRLIAKGDVDQIAGVIEELGKIGTSAGRILRHFAELKSSTPIGFTSMINSLVEKAGNTLSDKQQNKLLELTNNWFQLSKEAEQLQRKAVEGDLKAGQEFDNKVKELKKAERELSTFTNTVVERGWSDIASTLIVGNLLTPLSQATNVVANMANLLVDIPVNVLALPIEKFVNIFGIDSPLDNKRRYSMNAYLHGLKRFGQGFTEALQTIATGQEKDNVEWRVYRGFMPFRSTVAAMRGEGLPLGPDGKMKLSQRIKLFAQGTIGAPAEVMLRLLGLGDTPFRRFKEGIELYQAGINMGLEGDALKNFLKFPTKEQKLQAEKEGRKFTFQEETGLSKTFEELLRVVENKSPAAKVLLRYVAPFRRTPANITLETLTFFSPPVAIGRIFGALKKNNAREASQHLAKLTIGGMIGTATAELIRQGLISGPIDWTDEEEKNLMYSEFPPNSINATGLQRYLAGGDPSIQEGDVFRRYDKLGIIGAIMGSKAKVGVTEDDADPFSVNSVMRDAFGVSSFSTIANIMDQGFLQGVNGLLSVLGADDEEKFQKESNRWLSSMFQSISATVMPNTLSSISRMNRMYMPDFRITDDMDYTEQQLTKLSYILNEKTFNVGDIPVRTNWKGEPILQNPKGSNRFAYNLFDVTKARQGDADPVSMEIYRLYNELEDVSSMMATPTYAQKRKLSIPDLKSKSSKDTRALRRLQRSTGKTYSFLNDKDFMKQDIFLNTEQINQLLRVSNAERYEEAMELVNSGEYNRLLDQDRIKALNKVASNYNSFREFGDKGTYKNHTIMLLDMVQEIYENQQR